MIRDPYRSGQEGPRTGLRPMPVTKVVNAHLEARGEPFEALGKRAAGEESSFPTRSECSIGSLRLLRMTILLG